MGLLVPDHGATDTGEGSLGLALLLAGLAGWVDVVGLRQTGGVFLSFMSGNTTDLGASIVQGNVERAEFIAAVILSFVGGVAVGTLIERPTGRFGPSLVLAVEACLLAAAVATFPDGRMAFCLVLAMGVQTTAMRRVGTLTIGLTYVTGTLVQVGRSIAAGRFRTAVLYALVWFSLAAGAACGAVAATWSTPGALTLASAVALLLAAVTTSERMVRPMQPS